MRTTPPTRPHSIAASALLALAALLLAGCHADVRADRPAADILDAVNAEIPRGTLATEALDTLHTLDVSDITVGPARPGSGATTIITGKLPDRGLFGVRHPSDPRPPTFVELSFDDGGFRRAAHVLSFPARAEAPAK